MSSTTAKSPDWLKKPQLIRYSTDYKNELSRLLGAYAFFITNRQYERAFWNLWLSMLHVYHDPDNRVLKPQEGGSDVQKKSDNELKATFEELKTQFEAYVGLAKVDDGEISYLSGDSKLSYLAMKPRYKPRPQDHVVWIAADVDLSQAWDKATFDYLTKIAGFVYPENQQQGPFSVQVLKPQFTFVDKDSPYHAENFDTNCIPYVVWEMEVRAILAIIIPIAKQLELIIAKWLHDEFYYDEPEQKPRNPMGYFPAKLPSVDAVGGYEVATDDDVEKLHAKQETDQGGFDHEEDEDEEAD